MRASLPTDGGGAEATNGQRSDASGRVLSRLIAGTAALRAENEELRVELARLTTLTRGELDPWPNAGDTLTAEIIDLRAQVELLQEQASTDALTGLANRRAWDAGLRNEVARARRARTPLCVALIDLDRFKAHNDSHGHLAGDRLLVEVASAWREQIREIDLLSRWGGDELALLLPHCPPAGATEVIERLMASTPGEQRCTTGIAWWDAHEAPEALLDRADQELCRAKQIRTGTPQTGQT